MSDPIKDLENFNTDGIAVTPLPASEVRRRGERLRRRQHALVAGAGAAVVAIALPVAFLAGGTQRADDPVDPGPTDIVSTDSASRKVVTQIPDSFPIAVDLQRQEDGTTPRPSRDQIPPAPEPCGQDLRAVDGFADALGVRATYPAEGSDGRALRTFDSDTRAEQAVRELRRAAEACPTQPIGADVDGSFVWTLTETPLGDEAFTLTQTYDVGLGGAIYQVVRVGNAVLVTESGGEWELTTTVPVGIQERTALAERLVQEMCVFAENPCVVEGTPATGSTTIPGDFPLSRGQVGPDGEKAPAPVRGNTGLMPVELCDRGDWSVEPIDRLSSTVRAQDYVQWRQVVTFSDADTAVDVLETLRIALRECPSQVVSGRGGNGTEMVNRALFDTLGYDTLTWARGEPDGGESLVVHQFVRVGSAILAVTVEERTTIAEAQTLANQLSAITAGLAPEMCLFTVAGCGTTVTPDGVDGLRLGMPAAQVEDTVAVTHTSGPGAEACRTMEYLGDGSSPVLLSVSRKLGLAAIRFNATMETPEGITIGSTRKQVDAAYPQAEDAENATFVPIKGHPDRRYAITYDEGRVGSLALELVAQDCYR